MAPARNTAFQRPGLAVGVVQQGDKRHHCGSAFSLAASNSVNASYFTRVLRIAYLEPDIIEAIIEGRQSPELTANKLVRLKNLPIDWPGQREALGFPHT